MMEHRTTYHHHGGGGGNVRIKVTTIKVVQGNYRN
jgi:hypothetical protein